MIPFEDRFHSTTDNQEYEGLSSTESRALKRDLDRLRYIQQRNNVISGTNEDRKPVHLKNTSSWMRSSFRESVDESEGKCSPAPVPRPRPRSNSLQLVSSDFRVLSGRRSSIGDVEATDPRPGSKLSHKLKVARESSEESIEDAGQPLRLGSSPPRYQTPLNNVKSTGMVKQHGHLTKVSSMTMKDSSKRDSMVKTERGVLIKPKTTSTKSGLSPLKRSKKKSPSIKIPTTPNKVIRDTSNANISILPEITSGDKSAPQKDSVCQLSSSLPETKTLAPILKKYGDFVERSKFTQRVTFDEESIRSSIMSGKWLETDEEKEKGCFKVRSPRPFSPPPAPQPFDEELDIPWMTPGVLPVRRRNSLPPLSVSFTDIQNAGSDDDDDDLFLSDVKTYEDNVAQNTHEEEQSTSGVESTESDDVDSCDDNEYRDVESESVHVTHREGSCFVVPVPVPRKTHLEDVDSEDEVKCDVVHSFTPRRRLKQNVLTSNKRLSGDELLLSE